MQEQALAGIRVLDLSRLLPGPFCSMLLQELGADVIKIEEPNGGDYLRWFPPLTGHSGAQFIALNRGKRSVALDLKPEEGRAALHRLLAQADVLIESFRPGVLARLGLSPESLCARYPRLVVCSISGYGQDGPMALRAGHDIDYLATGGVFALMGLPPRVFPIQVADIAGGALYGALGIVSALFQRERTGRGRALDVSMTEGSLSFMTVALAQTWGEGRPLKPGAELLTGASPGYRLYETADGGHLAVGALEPKFWAQFVHAIGRPDLLEKGLDLNDTSTQEEVARVLKSKPRAAWEEVFAACDACVEPVLPLEALAQHPQHAARRAIIEDPDGPPIVRSPIHQLHPPQTPRPAPALGEHTLAVLAEAGYSAETLAELRARGVIAVADQS